MTNDTPSSSSSKEGEEWMTNTCILAACIYYHDNQDDAFHACMGITGLAHWLRWRGEMRDRVMSQTTLYPK